MGADFDCPTGFSRQKKIEDPTNHSSILPGLQAAERDWDGLRVGISLTQLTPESESQMSLFDTGPEKQMALERTTDALKMEIQL